MRVIVRFIRLLAYHWICFIGTSKWYLSKFRNENFKDIIVNSKRNNKLVILANGPSLNKLLDSSSLDINNADVRVVNDFCRSPIFFKIKPSSYVLADPFFFSDELTERHELIFDALRHVDWNMELYLPIIVCQKMKERIDNNNISFCPYHSIPYSGWKKVRNYLFRKGLTMPRPQNVVIPSIFIGINQGYKQIELYGVDHSWTKELRVNRNNQVCLINNHFYDTNEPDLKPWYKGQNQPVYKMHEILRDLAWMFDGYHQLREYADSVGCEIVNHTPDSFIDAFERG